MTYNYPHTRKEHMKNRDPKSYRPIPTEERMVTKKMKKEQLSRSEVISLMTRSYFKMESK